MIDLNHNLKRGYIYITYKVLFIMIQNIIIKL